MSNRKESANDAISRLVDVETFVALIRDRPTLYDFHLKDYRNKDVVEKTWKEVATKMDVSVADCKSKWHSLRNGYARHMREEEKYNSNASGENVSKRIKWYMADNLKFLSDYIRQPKKLNSKSHSSDKNQTDKTKVKTSDVVLSEDLDEQSEHKECVEKDSGNESINVIIKKRSGSKRQKPSFSLQAPKVCCAPTIEIKEDGASPSCKRLSQEYGDSDLHFFKSLLPDLRRLHPRRQRKFKAGTIQLLYELLDEQEEESTSHGCHWSSPVFAASNLQSPCSSHSSQFSPSGSSSNQVNY